MMNSCLVDFDLGGKALANQRLLKNIDATLCSGVEHSITGWRDCFHKKPFRAKNNSTKPIA